MMTEQQGEWTRKFGALEEGAERTRSQLKTLFEQGTQQTGLLIKIDGKMDAQVAAMAKVEVKLKEMDKRLGEVERDVDRLRFLGKVTSWIIGVVGLPGLGALAFWLTKQGGPPPPGGG